MSMKGADASPRSPSLMYEGGAFNFDGRRLSPSDKVGYGQSAVVELLSYTLLCLSCKSVRGWHKSHKDEVREMKSSVDWKTIALHSLSDLRAMGVPIERIILMTPEILAAVDHYDREMTAYS